MKSMNRSNANLAIFILSLAGCFVSLFLAVKYAQKADIPCMRGSSDCNAVARDAAAWGLGVPALSAVPTPVFGLLMYGTLAALAMARVILSSPSLSRNAATLQWAVGLIGVGVSAYLTWREAAVIHHWCVWCVGSAIIILLIFLFSSAERLAAVSRVRSEKLEAA